jgi:hypothetical protein
VLADLIQTAQKLISERRERVRHGRRVNLCEANAAGVHGERVVVKGARVRERIRPGGIVRSHNVCSASESTKRDASSQPFSKGFEIGRDATHRTQAVRRETRGHDFVKDDEDASLDNKQ